MARTRKATVPTGGPAAKYETAPDPGVPPGGAFGERKELEAVRAGTTPGAAGARSSSGGAMPPGVIPLAGSVTMPTDFPYEPQTAGAPIGEGFTPANPYDQSPDFDTDVLLEAMNQVFPHPIFDHLRTRGNQPVAADPSAGTQFEKYMRRRTSQIPDLAARAANPTGNVQRPSLPGSRRGG